MQHSSAGLRPAGRRVAAVVAAGAVALSLFAGAWASTHELTTQANGSGRNRRLEIPSSPLERWRCTWSPARSSPRVNPSSSSRGTALPATITPVTPLAAAALRLSSSEPR